MRKDSKLKRGRRMTMSQKREDIGREEEGRQEVTVVEKEAKGKSGCFSWWT